METVYARVICRNCGHKGEDHGGDTNPVRPRGCPADGPFPKWPKSIKDDKKAGELFDKRLKAYWSKRKTTFSPSV